MVNLFFSNELVTPANNCIAWFTDHYVEIDTDAVMPLSSSLTFYVKIGTYLDSSYFPESLGIPTDTNVWKVVFPVGYNIGVPTPFSLSFMGSGNTQNRKRFNIITTADNNGGWLRLGFEIVYVESVDTEDYYNTAVVQNNQKLLRDSISNSQNLNNNGITSDVYSTNCDFRFAIWCKDGIGDVSRYVLATPKTLSFYDSNNFITDPSFRIERCNGTTVDTISNTELNKLYFTCDVNTVTPTSSFVWAIRADRFDNTVNFIENYKCCCVDTATCTSDMLTSFGLIPTVGGVQPQLFNFTGCTNITNLTGSTWGWEVELNEANYPANSKWRFISVIFVGLSDTYYSFISDEYVVSECGCKYKPTIILNGVYNHTDFCGDYISTTPFEDLNHRFKVDATVFNAQNVTPLLNAVKNVRVEVFSYPNPLNTNIKTYYYDFNIYRDVLNPSVFIAPSQPNNTFYSLVIDSNTLDFKFQHKVRWEDNLTALYGVNGNSITSTSDVMNMAGRDVYCFFTVTTEQVNGVKEKWIFKHRLKVNPLGNITDFPLKYESNDENVTLWCGEAVKKCFDTDYCRLLYAFAAVQKPQYSISDSEFIDDNLSFSPSIYLQNSTGDSMLISSSANYFNSPIGSPMCVSINPVSPFPDLEPSLETDTSYKLAIWGNNFGINNIDFTEATMYAYSEPQNITDTCNVIDSSFLDYFKCGTKFTFSTWIYFTTGFFGTNEITLLEVSEIAGSDIYFKIYLDILTSNIYIILQNGTSTDIAVLAFGMPGIYNGLWHNIIVTVDMTDNDIFNMCKVYIDATPLSQLLVETQNNPTNDNCIHSYLGNPFKVVIGYSATNVLSPEYYTIHNMFLSDRIYEMPDVSSVFQLGAYNNPYSYDDIILFDMLSNKFCVQYVECDDLTSRQFAYYRDGIMYNSLYVDTLVSSEDTDVGDCGSCINLIQFLPNEYL